MASPLFTIEQIEWIRRLRQSGISKEQVVLAFEEMDRLETTTSTPALSGHVPTPALSGHVPTPASFTISGNPVISLTPSSPSASINTVNTLDNHVNHSNSLNGMRNSVSPTLDRGFVRSLSVESSSELSLSPQSQSSSQQQQIQQLAASALKGKELVITPVNPMSYSQPTSSTSAPSLFGTAEDSESSSRSMSQPTGSSGSAFSFDETPELVVFKRKGERMMLAEIRSFVLKYNIRQNMIAEMTRISQGYISRFFRGEGHDMSERAKNLIYMWYLQCKNNPARIIFSCPNTVGEKKIISETGDLLPIRRDRFIFRRQHLAILERYFEENPYPDAHIKEQVSDECNKAVERLSSRPLPERDRVTVAIVSNWFNNKRKDLKSKKIGRSSDNLSQSYSVRSESPSSIGSETHNYSYNLRRGTQSRALGLESSYPDIEFIPNLEEENESMDGLSIVEDDLLCRKGLRTYGSECRLKNDFGVKSEPQ